MPKCVDGFDEGLPRIGIACEHWFKGRFLKAASVMSPVAFLCAPTAARALQAA
jgi:hypothetical protein